MTLWFFGCLGPISVRQTAFSEADSEWDQAENQHLQCIIFYGERKGFFYNSAVKLIVSTDDSDKSLTDGGTVPSISIGSD